MAYPSSGINEYLTEVQPPQGKWMQSFHVPETRLTRRPHRRAGTERSPALRLCRVEAEPHLPIQLESPGESVTPALPGPSRKGGSGRSSGLSFCTAARLPGEGEGEGEGKAGVGEPGRGPAQSCAHAHGCG